MEIQVGDIIQLQKATYHKVGEPADRFLIVTDPCQFNLSNKSKFSCWDTRDHKTARVTIIDNSAYVWSIFEIRPEFEEVTYVGLIINTSYLASTHSLNSKEEPAIWHEIILRKVTDV